MSLKRVVSAIKNHRKFLITSHTNLEGDAVGAELAFFWLVQAMGKYATIVNVDNLPSEYDFLPGIKRIKKFKGNLKKIKFDCFVILDCSDLNRCGKVAQINRKPIINIDHHISNERFGDINWVEPQASSTCEMIYQLYKELHVPLNRNVALALYTGILIDTGSFHYRNTTRLTHKIVSELLKYKLDISRIYKQVYENIPFKDMRLFSRILPTLKLQFDGRLAYFKIKRELLKNVSIDLSEQLLTFARAIKGVEIAVLFKENFGPKDEVRVNFRSQGKVNVNKIANFFGGGGHKTASGATVKGKIDQVRKEVLAKIKESLG
jgi:phosphoesterase RecJ-like protein